VNSLLKLFISSVVGFAASSSVATTYYNPPATPASSRTKICEAQFAARVQQKMAAGVPAKHLPRLYMPAYNPKRTVVIFTHGLFESPYFFKAMNNVIANQGFVSMSILLPGHWQGDWSSLKKITYVDWITELRENVRIAQCFGDKIIFAGHSVGGLLSMNAALEYPQITAGVMLWSPAVDLKALPALGGFIGGLFHISGNLVMGSSNLDEVPYYAPNGAKQVGNAIDYISSKYGNGKMKNVYARMTAPTFFAYAQNDPAIDVDELTRAAHSIKGLNIQDVMYFPESTGVAHGNITKGKIDAYKKMPWDHNPKFLEMQAHVESFLRNF
jgi:pimeloyl-ACP methyl ester carboxylesterase